MTGTYYKEWSFHLNREMEFKVFGTGGRPFVVFPCQSGRFFDWENFGMVDTAAPWLENGRMQLFCVDSIDPESWDCPGGDPRRRVEMQERWYRYLTEEFYGRIRQLNGGQNDGRVVTTGASMGGGHAMNLYLRRPDLFNGVIALSGLYSSRMFFGDYMDDLVYLNSPIDYMRNIAPEHPYLAMFRRANPLILCCGQGAWEGDLLASTRELAAVLAEKGVPADVEIWGPDVSHDWFWWKKQWPLFLARVLGAP